MFLKDKSSVLVIGFLLTIPRSLRTKSTTMPIYRKLWTELIILLIEGRILNAAAPNNPIKDTKDNPRTQAFASKNWRVSKKRANPSKEASLDNEVCIISIKAGGTKLPVLEDNKGNTVTDVEVNSVNLLEELHGLRAWIQDLKEAPKTRKDKKELHETLKAAYKPKKDASKYSYNADSDKWLAK